VQTGGASSCKLRSRAAMLRLSASYLLCIANCAAAATGVPKEHGYVVRDASTGRLLWESKESDERPSDALVHGSFEDSIQEIGTGKLKLATASSTATDVELFEALGFAEGALTAGRIVQHMHNMFEQKPVAAEVGEFMLENMAYMQRQVDAHAEEDPYWSVVATLLARNRGLRDGFRSRLGKLELDTLLVDSDGIELMEQAALLRQRSLLLQSLPEQLLDMELLRLNLVMDIDEIARAVNKSSSGATSSELAAAVGLAEARASGGHGHCSVLVKVAGSQIIFGHNTWKDFKEMLRIWKDISIIHVQNPAIVNRRLSYPSYPGYYASTDDWLMLPDSQLAVFETTDDAYDTARLAKHVQPSTINTPMRSMIASLMAGNGREWYDTFSRENSGTQNNQWMIIDAAAWHTYLSSRDAKPAGVLWVLEQQPGSIVGHDMTEHLLRESFWSSYNVPHFEQTMLISRVKEHPSVNGACVGQRGPLLASAQRHIASVADMQKLLTTNQWETSSLAWSCPKCSVASRFDLPGSNSSMGKGVLSGHEMEHVSHFGSEAKLGCHFSGFFGAIDAKVADDRMVAEGKTLFVSGPARNGGIPAFSWEAAEDAAPKNHVPQHAGHPKGPWTFPWVTLGGVQHRDHFAAYV